jgi:hypothetical protein
MFDVDQLKAVGIQERFDGLCETYSVLPDVLDFFFRGPIRIPPGRGYHSGKIGCQIGGGGHGKRCCFGRIQRSLFNHSAPGFRQQAFLGVKTY